MSVDSRPIGPRTHAASAPAVPWGPVLLLAAVLAAADGFWATALRGAVGAIERTSGPFQHWLRESTLLLPLFVVAVLVASAVGLRAFGPSRRDARTVVCIGLLVAGTGSLVGTLVVAGNAAYDYLLQWHQLVSADAMSAACPGCLEVQRQESLWLQVRAVGWGALILLVTNVVLVAWVVAASGGRLRLATARRARSDPDGTPPASRSRRDARVRQLIGQ